MIRHVLVTPRADVSARWQAAFPAGRRMPSLTAARAVRGPAIVWLDLTNMQQDARTAAIAACATREVSVVALNTRPSEDEARLSLRAGARGYCHALAAPSQLRRVADVVRRNGYWLGRSLVNRIAAVLSGRAPASAAHPGIERLGERERQIAEHVSRGASNSEVAASLGLAEGQVQFHLAAILDRLRIRNRVQLALRYHP